MSAEKILRNESGRRRPRSIEIPGVTHGKAPIPMGARVGNLIVSSAIPGKDPATGKLPDDAASQVRFAFLNLGRLLEAGGASMEDIVRLTALVKDDSIRDALNTEWLKHFSDPQDRPARHTIVQDLRGAMLVQLEVMALAGGGRP